MDFFAWCRTFRAVLKSQTRSSESEDAELAKAVAKVQKEVKLWCSYEETADYSRPGTDDQLPRRNGRRSEYISHSYALPSVLRMAEPC